MNLRQIEVFRAVMTTGSVTDAARLLHVSVPAVSRVLSHMESQLNFPLFSRTKGRLAPTEEGRRLFHEIESVYSGVQRISDLAHELKVRRSSFVSLVSSPGIGHMLVPMAIAQFHAAHPDTHLSFNTLNQELLEQRILTRHFDLGIAMDRIDHPHLVSIPIARSRIVCICAHTHPLAARRSVSAGDLLSHEVLSYPAGTPFGDLLRGFFASVDGVPKMTIEVGSPQHACALIQLGGGIALVDEFSLQAWSDARFCVLPIEEMEPLVAYLVHLRVDAPSPAANEFVRTLRCVCAQRGLAMPDEIDPPADFAARAP